MDHVGALENHIQRGALFIFFLSSALDRCVELGISGLGDRAAGGSHARASAAWEMLCHFFCDQILIRSWSDEILMCPIYLLNNLKYFKYRLPKLWHSFKPFPWEVDAFHGWASGKSERGPPVSGLKALVSLKGSLKSMHLSPLMRFQMQFFRKTYSNDFQMILIF